MTTPDQNPQDASTPGNRQPSAASKPSPSPLSLAERLQQLLQTLETDMYERETALRLGLLAALAGESLFMLGPPGVAKSLVARRLKHAFVDAKAFEYLMNRFSTPDEIFGPVSISKLTENDSYERVTDAYLPGAEVVFLDEIWKAGPSIQNTLLTVLNEKIYRNGAQEVKVPMRLLVAASNELPAEGEGLEALYDRFLIRLLVGPLQDDKNFLQMIVGDSQSDVQVPAGLAFTEVEFDALRQQLTQVKIPQEVKGMILTLRQQIAEHNRKLADASLEEADDETEGPADQPLYVSDRRWKKAVGLLRASALMHDRKSVAPEDCFVLPHVLWDRPEQHGLIAKWIEEAIRERGAVSGVDLAGLEAEIRKFYAEVKKEIEREEVFERKEPIVHGNKFYKIISGDCQNLYILKSEYDRLAKKQQDPLANLLGGGIDLIGQIFDKSSKTNINRSIGKVVGAETVRLYNSPNDHHVGPQTEILVDASDSCKFLNGKGQGVIEHKGHREKRMVKRSPNPYMIKAWNDQITQMKNQLDEAATGLTQLRPKGKSGGVGHLFASGAHQQLVAEGLARSQNQLDKLKLALIKIVDEYSKA